MYKEPFESNPEPCNSVLLCPSDTRAEYSRVKWFNKLNGSTLVIHLRDLKNKISALTYEKVLGSVADPDPDWIRFQGIRIQEGKNDP